MQVVEVRIPVGFIVPLHSLLGRKYVLGVDVTGKSLEELSVCFLVVPAWGSLPPLELNLFWMLRRTGL